MNSDLYLLIIGLITIVFFFVLMRLLKKRNFYKKNYQELQDRYKDVMDLEAYKAKVQKDADDVLKYKEDRVTILEKDISDLKASYAKKHDYYDQLLDKIKLYEDQEDFLEYGLYTPRFNFDTSERYKKRILDVREDQKNYIKNGLAAHCPESWTINGSKAEGTKQTKRYIKLMLRAFNGECDAMIADVRWNNVTKFEDRLVKSFETINKLGETHMTYITKPYMELKLLELRLTHEYNLKLHEEKEEQRLIREQIREEEKLQKEIEKKQKELEKKEREEAELQKKLKEAYEQGKKDEIPEYEAKISDLQQIIEDSKRKISEAQKTKNGTVYIISNIGSFGENVYKIGMTRRINPQERIDELGSASVPFEFDVHATIKTENAPELETKLHKYFSSKRVNLANPRKEFFNVSLDEIEKYFADNNLDATFNKTAAADEYRQTLAIRNSQDPNYKPPKIDSDIPNMI